MSVRISPYWTHARKSFEAAKHLIAVDDDSCISRAYYTAFYAMSAVLSSSGQEFTKHSAVEAAVHRDIVRTGRLEASLGQDYSFLLKLRYSSDYDMEDSLPPGTAEKAVAAAQRILDAVHQLDPNLFPLDD